MESFLTLFPEAYLKRHVLPEVVRIFSEKGLDISSLIHPEKYQNFKKLTSYELPQWIIQQERLLKVANDSRKVKNKGGTPGSYVFKYRGLASQLVYLIITFFIVYLSVIGSHDGDCLNDFIADPSAIVRGPGTTVVNDIYLQLVNTTFDVNENVPYNNVATLQLHNAFSTGRSFLQNQYITLYNSLILSGRIDLDIKKDADGLLYVYHSPPTGVLRTVIEHYDPSRTSVREIFAATRNVLIHYPKHIVSINIENTVPVSEIYQALSFEGLDEFLYNHPGKKYAWPTYKQLVEQNNRLIVFIDNYKEQIPENHRIRKSMLLTTDYFNENDYRCIGKTLTNAVDHCNDLSYIQRARMDHGERHLYPESQIVLYNRFANTAIGKPMPKDNQVSLKTNAVKNRILQSLRLGTTPHGVRVQGTPGYTLSIDFANYIDVHSNLIFNARVQNFTFSDEQNEFLNHGLRAHFNKKDYEIRTANMIVQNWFRTDIITTTVIAMIAWSVVSSRRTKEELMEYFQTIYDQLHIPMVCKKVYVDLSLVLVCQLKKYR